MNARSWASSERQGNGRRFWFVRAEQAIAFAKAKRAAGWTVIADRDGWNDPDVGPNVWIGPRGKRSAETRGYLAGVDTLSGGVR